MGDYPQFDPGVFTEGDRTYLYTGFGMHAPGALVTVLDKDMLIKEGETEDGEHGERIDE